MLIFLNVYYSNFILYGILMSNKKCIGNCIGKNERYIHPFSLTSFKNINNINICPTKTSENICDTNPSINEIVKFMEKPYVYIDYTYLNNEVFENKEVDDIEKWIKTNISKPEKYINRVINIWIKSNIDDLKKYNELLIKVLGKYFIIKKKLDSKKYSKKISEYIQKWIQYANINDFYFDLIYDIENHLKLV